MRSFVRLRWTAGLVMVRSSAKRNVSNHTLKKKFGFLNLFSLLLVSSALLLWFIVPGFAQSASSTDMDDIDVTSDENNVCLEQIMPQAMVYYADITSFISTHYLSEDSASDLLDTALAKFDEYKTNMHTLLATYRVADPGQPIAQEIDELNSQCATFVEVQIREVKQMLRNHHLANAGRKVTYTLVTQLKTINEGLRDMNEDFARMYALFTTLSNKLTSVSK